MTKLHVHELAGLKPDALTTYLAALRGLRLLTEQKDAQFAGSGAPCRPTAAQVVPTTTGGTSISRCNDE